MLLALAGAAIVLWPAERSGWDALPLPRSLPDWLGVLGGFSFALNNVMLRREAHRPEEGRALAMFVGGMSVAGVLALRARAGAAACAGCRRRRRAGWPAWPALALLFLAGNLALQYGAARLPANVTVGGDADRGAVRLGLGAGAGRRHARRAAAGAAVALILLAALLSTLEPRAVTLS